MIRKLCFLMGPAGCETGGIGNFPANHLTPKLNPCIPTVWEHSQREKGPPGSFSFFPGLGLMGKVSPGLDCGAYLWAQDPELSCPSCVPESLKYNPPWSKEGAGLDWNKKPGFGGEWESPRGKRGGGWDGIMEWGRGRLWSLLIFTVPLLQSLLPGSLAVPSATHPVSDIGQALRRYRYCLGWTCLAASFPGFCQISMSFL